MDAVMAPITDARHHHTAERRNATALPFTLYRDIDPTPRKRMTVAGFLGDGELSCYFGSPGTAKSAILGDLGGHVAADRAWFGRNVTPGAVLYVAAERASLVKRRFAAFRKYHQLVDLPLAVVSGAVDLRSSAASAKAIVEHGKHLVDLTGQPLRLVIIETISRILAGGDENSPKDMGAVIGNLSLIQDATGAHVTVAHHIPADGTQRLRGHGALLGACDTTVKVEKNGLIRTATVDKVNDGDEGEHVTFRLESVDLYQDPETGEVTTAPVVVPSDEPQAIRERVKLSPIQRAGLDALHECMAEQGQLPPSSNHIPQYQKAVTLSDWREHLLKAGIINAEGNPREQFRRIRVTLQNAKIIGVWDEYVWAVT